MRIKKVLNNNTLIIDDDGVEKVVMGLGIGFQKKANDLVDRSKIEKIFTMTNNQEYKKFKEILETLPAEHIHLAEQIISHAEQTLHTELNEHIHVALTDHISFAIERITAGMSIHNELLEQIKAVYPEEYAIGTWAQRLISQTMQLTIPEDEAGFIALHVRTARMGCDELTVPVDVSYAIRDMVDIIVSDFDLTLAEESLPYQRLVTHLRFAFQRLLNKQPFHGMDDDIYQVIKEKCGPSFQCALRLRAYVEAQYGLTFPDAECAYIALHIHKVADF
ncbi:PRD domain-containing protein [Propionispora hippei]|uniref:Transcriptional antiterminator, BglG family n=1 Tax=Propionispora hippei DSM 15287 TaxID=1123003 RepID=A0A1M6G7J1_9FIRM|nr:PRD domain-containing protein [Propionispora hippei]SHJ05896.1 transcriptional antiterminator, BglG family [Propionispora hippei DSM 15287]